MRTGLAVTCLATTVAAGTFSMNVASAGSMKSGTGALAPVAADFFRTLKPVEVLTAASSGRSSR